MDGRRRGDPAAGLFRHRRGGIELRAGGAAAPHRAARGERLLPEARAVLAAAGRTRQIAASIAAGADGLLRVGTSQGLGERLDQVLEELRRAAPSLEVRLVSAPVAERLARVRSGQLDVAFVRAVTTAPGVELLPIWHDPLTVALPAAHPLAAQPARPRPNPD